MKRIRCSSYLAMVVLSVRPSWLLAQSVQATDATATVTHASPTTPVPPLVRYGGALSGIDGKPLTGIVGLTFSLYKDEQGGAPLWLETQNVQLDKTGHYTVMLGSTSNYGLPSDIFSSGEARWIGVQLEGQAERPRVLLLSVPYALKAADAETLGGLPPSAFMRTPRQAGAAASSPTTDAALTLPTVHGSGTLNFLPIWTGSTTIGNSLLFQSTGKLGIGTTTPTTTLDVKGSATIRGNQTVIGNLSDTGNISATGSISGQRGSFVGSTSLFTNLLSAVQSGSGTAISGFASAATGVTFAVSGFASSPSGVGVSGEGGTGILGIGYVSSGGTGVSGSGKYGVRGTSSVSSGAGGVFSNPASGEALSAQINGREVFGVYPGATVVNGGGLVVGGNGASMIQGDPGCGSGFAGIGFTSLAGCNTYSLIGDGKHTYLNRPLGGALFFRENNGDNMIIAPGGAVGIGTTSPNAKFDVRGSAGNSGLGIATDSNAWQARGANGWVKAMVLFDPGQPAGSQIVNCYNSQQVGAAVSTPPCGISVLFSFGGDNNLDFGFQLTDRFVQVTPYLTVGYINGHGPPGVFANTNTSTFSSSSIEITTYDTSRSLVEHVPFYLFVF